jgi:hypothetical protein
MGKTRTAPEAKEEAKTPEAGNVAAPETKPEVPEAKPEVPESASEPKAPTATNRVPSVSSSARPAVNVTIKDAQAPKTVTFTESCHGKDYERQANQYADELRSKGIAIEIN